MGCAEHVPSYFVVGTQASPGDENPFVEDDDEITVVFGAATMEWWMYNGYLLQQKFYEIIAETPSQSTAPSVMNTKRCEWRHNNCHPSVHVVQLDASVT